MKIAYLGKMQLTDVDFSYLHEAQKIADISYYLEVSPRYQNGPGISISNIHPKSGIFKAKDVYDEFKKYADFVDLDKIYVVNASGRLWIIKSLWINIILLLHLVKNKFDIIHITWPLNVYEFILYLLRKRMMLTVHDPFPHSGQDTKIVNFRRNIAFSLLSNFIILNRNQRKEFINYYHLENKKVINSNLSSYSYLEAISNNTNGNKAECEYILAFGKISKYKGFDYLLPAMKQVHKAHPNCKLIIAGKGQFHFDIDEYTELDYIDIRNRFIPEEEMISLVKNCLFMVCPYTDATQSGVIMSSYAFCRPVVATNVGGLPEMVVDGKYGLVIKERDENALVEAITKLLDNRNMIDEFSKKIEEDYAKGEKSWHEIARELVCEYQRLSKPI